MWSSLIVGLTSLLSFTSAFYIDEKCSKDDADRVRKAMNSALSMTYNGLAQADQTDVVNTQVRQWLFGSKLSDSNHVSRIQDAFNGITSNIQPEVHSANDLHANDVRIYCDLSRLELKGTYYWDDNIKERVPWNTKLDCARAFMWTSNPADRSKYSQIQICPWFLRYEAGWKFQTTSDVTANAWAAVAKLLDGPITKWKYSPIDMRSLFDKVMLHELTHLKSSAETDDVGGFKGYGWKNCLELAKSHDPTSLDGGPYQNADTFALYGSVSTLLVTGGSIHEDGTFEEPPNPAPASGSGGGAKLIKRQVLESPVGSIGNDTAVEHWGWEFTS